MPLYCSDTFLPVEDLHQKKIYETASEKSCVSEAGPRRIERIVGYVRPIELGDLSLLWPEACFDGSAVTGGGAAASPKQIRLQPAALPVAGQVVQDVKQGSMNPSSRFHVVCITALVAVGMSIAVRSSMTPRGFFF